jgi:hypothetical protein
MANLYLWQLVFKGLAILVWSGFQKLLMVIL